MLEVFKKKGQDYQVIEPFFFMRDPDKSLPHS